MRTNSREMLKFEDKVVRYFTDSYGDGLASIRIVKVL